MLKRLSPRLAILIAAAIVVACGSEQALLVSPRLDGSLPLGIVADTAGARVFPVSRERPLVRQESWSFDASPAGSVVRHPSTGLTITIPSGAVASTTHITVTALQGSAIAYRFEPHGLQFAVPLQLTQSLRGAKIHHGTLANAPLLIGYFASDTLATDAATGQARVMEILPVLIDLKGQNAILSVRHFSGYTVASAVDGADSLAFAR
jgi:hypothetical protein